MSTPDITKEEALRALRAVVCDYVPVADVENFHPWLKAIVAPIIEEESVAIAERIAMDAKGNPK